MKLRFFTVLLIIFLIVSMTCPVALADMIWTPNDTFYEKEYDNCIYHGRSYTANGEDGTVTVRITPGADETVAHIKNSNAFYVSFTYNDQNGERWGVVQFTYDEAGNVTPEYLNKGETGWIRMTDLALIYDYISFAEDHQSEFKPYTGNYEEFKTGDKIVFWSYPGSGILVSEDVTREIGKLFSIKQMYTDTENRLWGFVDYYYGRRNVWVCISNPAGAGIETAQTPQDNNTPVPPSDQTPALPSGETIVVQTNQTPMLLIIAAAVIVLVVITGVIIVVFWKKNTKRDEAFK